MVIYHWDVKGFPDNIIKKTGEGFHFSDEKIVTKYPCGVALLQFPFEIAAHIYATHSNKFKPDGFSKPYHKAIDFAAAFYGAIGLMFLFLFLRNYFKTKDIIITLFLILSGTNLLYYTIRDTGMSHIYSFALFSGYLFFSKRCIDKDFKPNDILILGILAGLIVLTRFMNIIFLPVVIFLDVNAFSTFKKRLRFISQSKFIWIFGLSTFIILLPQVIYYYYLSGSLFMYSYGNEGFTNILNPRILPVLFSPDNGMLLFSPILIIMLIGMVLGIKGKLINNYLAISFFVGVTLIIASWWSWELGCSYGHRGFIEFYSIFSIPFCFAIQSLNKFLGRFKRFAIYVGIFLLVLYSLKNSYKYDGCYYGKGKWDWKYHYHFIID